MTRRQPLFNPLHKRLAACARGLLDVELGDVDALHRTRVASRRLRELLPLLALDRMTTRKLTRRLRSVTRQFGVVRELDVLAGLIDHLHGNRRFSPIALTTISEALGRARDDARRRLAATLPTRKLQRLAKTLHGAMKSSESTGATVPGRTDQRWLSALGARLTHRATRVRTAIERAGALYAPAPLHDVRIALKKLRYSAELKLESGDPRLAADIAALTAAQDLLGRLHDCEVLIAWGRDAQASLSPLDLVMWRELRSLVHALEDDCRGMHARYMRDRAGLIAIANRLGAAHTVPSFLATRIKRGDQSASYGFKQ